MNRNLIYDLGMHRALDSDFYLKKGFKVVALEANPDLVQLAETKHAKDIADGRFFIEHKALWKKEDEEISFFVNHQKDDWSSVIQKWAEKGGHETKRINVTSTTLNKLFREYGEPYYIKCDIEGADEVFLRQLLSEKHRPNFVSVEGSFDALALLRAAGYDRFQLINQAFLNSYPTPDPAREGILVKTVFNGYMSGLFGRELDPKNWLNFSDTCRNYVTYRQLKIMDEQLSRGWLDIHATFTKNI